MSEQADQETVGGVTLATFTQWVHSALRQLYDFSALEKNPLAERLGGARGPGVSRAQNLRLALLTAIRAMRPPPDTPAEAHDWRDYRILQMRYVDGLSPDEAMGRLALQKSRYYHDQARAIEALVQRLWGDYRAAAASAPVAPDALAGAPQKELIHAETERFYAQAAQQELDAAQLVQELRSVLDPLAAARSATFTLQPSPPLILNRANRVLLRQAILHAVSDALDARPGGFLEIAGLTEPGRVGLRVRAWSPPGAPLAERDPAQTTRQEMCQRLMATMGGSYNVAARGVAWEAQLVWQAEAISSVLVIDDNQGFVGLFRRYLTGHPWQIVGAANLAEARALIAETRPAAIILDVLMPEADGWDLMVALKADPSTRDIPIIICSVLHEPEIALSLGAAAYLPKPVTEQSLVEALRPFRQGAG